MANKRLFILTDLKQNPIQALQGELFGMAQSNACTWIRLPYSVSNHGIVDQDLLPARMADALAAMLATQPVEGPSIAPLLARWDRTPDPALKRFRGAARVLPWQEDVSQAQKPFRNQ
jgi:hypothetical protein